MKELRELENDGLDHREVLLKVEYSLTTIGQKFVPVIEVLERWAIEYEQYKDEQEL